VIGHSGLRAHYRGTADADDAPARNLDELITAAAEFHNEHPEATLLDWLEHTALLADVDTVRDGAGLVTLMTLHAAKGLEFDAVYVVGLEAGLLPFRRREEENGDEEEERRLLFVGMTRARKRLTLSHARFRMQRGSAERTVRSPFLDELPADEIEWDQAGIVSRPGREDGKGGRLPDDIEQWSVGTLVRHEVRGLGQIVSFERGARRTHVKVRFSDGSEQAWVLEFARLTRVDYDEAGDIDDYDS
jgi:DNA helicase-2/ATP-dependent DNA helicase PcrA